MRPHLSLLPWQPLFEHQQNILCLLSSEKLCSHNRGPCCTITTKALEEGRAGDREVPTPARAMLLMEQILPGKFQPQLPGQPLALVHSSSHPCRAGMCLFGFKTGGSGFRQGMCPMSCRWKCAGQSQICRALAQSVFLLISKC